MTSTKTTRINSRQPVTAGQMHRHAGHETEYAVLVERMLLIMEFDHEADGHTDGETPHSCSYCRWMKDARAAIAKATKETQ